jgi:hypothetical protein
MTVFVAVVGDVRIEMQENTQRVDRFIEAFENRIEGSPDPKMQRETSRFESQISVGGPRYDLRLATERGNPKKETCKRGTSSNKFLVTPQHFLFLPGF